MYWQGQCLKVPGDYTKKPLRYSHMPSLLDPSAIDTLNLVSQTTVVAKKTRTGRKRKWEEIAPTVPWSSWKNFLYSRPSSSNAQWKQSIIIVLEDSEPNAQIYKSTPHFSRECTSKYNLMRVHWEGAGSICLPSPIYVFVHIIRYSGWPYQEDVFEAWRAREVTMSTSQSRQQDCKCHHDLVCTETRKD